jgi:hypothetical protein
MIKREDFLAILKVFHGAVKEIAEKDTSEERKAVIEEWITLMGQVDRAMGGIIYENSKAERLAMVADFEKELKNFEGEEVIL